MLDAPCHALGSLVSPRVPEAQCQSAAQVLEKISQGPEKASLPAFPDLVVLIPVEDFGSEEEILEEALDVAHHVGEILAYPCGKMFLFLRRGEDAGPRQVVEVSARIAQKLIILVDGPSAAGGAGCGAVRLLRIT